MTSKGIGSKDDELQSILIH